MYICAYDMYVRVFKLNAFVRIYVHCEIMLLDKLHFMHVLYICTCVEYVIAHCTDHHQQTHNQQ